MTVKALKEIIKDLSDDTIVCCEVPTVSHEVFISVDRDYNIARDIGESKWIPMVGATKHKEFDYLLLQKGW